MIVSVEIAYPGLLRNAGDFVPVFTPMGSPIVCGCHVVLGVETHLRRIVLLFCWA